MDYPFELVKTVPKFNLVFIKTFDLVKFVVPTHTHFVMIRF
jgi:hypothetical protein